jgi:hypothetical protein
LAAAHDLKLCARKGVWVQVPLPALKTGSAVPQQLIGHQEPVAVILPRERPIPAVAMEEGFQHITVLPNQGVVELEPLMVKFKPFYPK